jgi:hypothetical protein
MATGVLTVSPSSHQQVIFSTQLMLMSWHSAACIAYVVWQCNGSGCSLHQCVTRDLRCCQNVNFIFKLTFEGLHSPTSKNRTNSLTLEGLHYF